MDPHPAPPHIDQTGRPDLPPEARAELARALALVEGGGGRLARAAGLLARVAGFAAAPVLHGIGRALGIGRSASGGLGRSAAGGIGRSAAGGIGRSAAGGAGPLPPAATGVIAQMMERAFDLATLALPAAPPEATHALAAPAAPPRPRAWRGRTAGELRPLPRGPARGSGARLAAIASGVVGGAAGLPGFLPDAAFTTLLILRAIAAIAVEQGEDLASESGRAACIEVFTLGAPAVPTAAGAAAAAANTEQEGYWTARLLVQGTPLMALIGQAASRFGIVLSEKLAVQAAPIAGAAGGALVNAAFLDHYRALAEGHFIIRRLERVYGVETVRFAAEG
jgi:hypothetical protein